MKAVTTLLKVGAMLAGLAFLLLFMLSLFGPILLPVVFYLPTIIVYTAAPILLALLGPRLLLRSRQQQRLPYDWALISLQALLLGLITFLVMYFSLTRMYAVAVFDFATDDTPTWGAPPPLSPELKNQLIPRRPEVIDELWRSLSLPPRLQHNCFSHIAAVCELAKRARRAYAVETRFIYYSPEEAYNWLLLVSLAAGTTGVASVIYPAIDLRRPPWLSGRRPGDAPGNG